MRLISNAIRKNLVLLVTLIIAPLLGGCWSGGPPEPHSPAVGTEGPILDPLRPGDAIRVDFSGTPTAIAPVQTEIKGDGTVRLEYIGDMQAAGLTPGQLEKAIQNAYVPLYYTHLSVIVTPAGRYFYVEGELNGSMGRILYEGPITVTRAIASAGDFNPFADRKHVLLFRVNGAKPITINCVKALVEPKLDLPVYPGDKIVVKRRLY